VLRPFPDENDRRDRSIITPIIIIVAVTFESGPVTFHSSRATRSGRRAINLDIRIYNSFPAYGLFPDRVLPQRVSCLNDRRFITITRGYEVTRYHNTTSRMLSISRLAIDIYEPIEYICIYIRVRVFAFSH